MFVPNKQLNELLFSFPQRTDFDKKNQVNDTMNVKVDRHEEKKAHEKTMYIK